MESPVGTVIDIPLEDPKDLPQDEGLPFEEEPLFEWLFEGAWPDEGADGWSHPGPGGSDPSSVPSGPGSIRAVEEPDMPDGEREQDPDAPDSTTDVTRSRS